MPAWMRVALTILGSGLLAWALLTCLMVGAYHWSDFSWGVSVMGALSNWPFTVGAGCLVGLGSLSGFSPEDL